RELALESVEQCNAARVVAELVSSPRSSVAELGFLVEGVTECIELLGGALPVFFAQSVADGRVITRPARARIGLCRSRAERRGGTARERLPCAARQARQALSLCAARVTRSDQHARKSQR